MEDENEEKLRDEQKLGVQDKIASLTSQQNRNWIEGIQVCDLLDEFYLVDTNFIVRMCQCWNIRDQEDKDARYGYNEPEDQETRNQIEVVISLANEYADINGIPGLITDWQLDEIRKHHGDELRVTRILCDFKVIRMIDKKADQEKIAVAIKNQSSTNYLIRLKQRKMTNHERSSITSTSRKGKSNRLDNQERAETDSPSETALARQFVIDLSPIKDGGDIAAQKEGTPQRNPTSTPNKDSDGEKDGEEMIRTGDKLGEDGHTAMHTNQIVEKEVEEPLEGLYTGSENNENEETIELDTRTTKRKAKMPFLESEDEEEKQENTRGSGKQHKKQKINPTAKKGTDDVGEEENYAENESENNGTPDETNDIKLHTAKNWGYKIHETMKDRPHTHVSKEELMKSIPSSAFEGEGKEMKEYLWCNGRFPNGEKCLHVDKNRNISSHYCRHHPQFLEVHKDTSCCKYTKIKVNKRHFIKRWEKWVIQKDRFLRRKLTTNETVTLSDGEIVIIWTPYRYNQKEQQFEKNKEKRRCISLEDWINHSDSETD